MWLVWLTSSFGSKCTYFPTTNFKIGWLGLGYRWCYKPYGLSRGRCADDWMVQTATHLPGDSYPSRKSLPALPQGTSEIDAGAAYLFQIHMAMKSQLSKTLGEVSTTEEGGILYSFTVPWGNDEEEKSLRAAMPQAGYLKSRNHDRLIVTTGSEAAAKYCLKTSMLHLEVKDVVLIVECGGQLWLSGLWAHQCKSLLIS